MSIKIYICLTLTATYPGVKVLLVTPYKWLENNAHGPSIMVANKRILSQSVAALESHGNQEVTQCVGFALRQYKGQH